MNSNRHDSFWKGGIGSKNNYAIAELHAIISKQRIALNNKKSE